MKLLHFPNRRGNAPAVPYRWRTSAERHEQVRLAQIVALQTLARRRGVRALRVAQPVDSYQERARAAQRRGFETFMGRLGGGHLY